MEKKSVKDLKKLANQIRQDVIIMLERAGCGHAGGSLGITDILTVLYFNILNYIPEQPYYHKRDRLVLSNGHVCPALYATLARAGYFPLVKLKSLRQLNSNLQGHPHLGSLPGIENSSGPLGQGISQAVGMALAGKMDKANYQIFCITSDGEHNEGQVWEAVMTANKYKLNNLINIVDRNNIQIDGYTKNIMPLKPLTAKYQSFGWKVLEVDGHNLKQLINTLKRAKLVKDKPTVIIANTTLGKGVKFMENNFNWHGKAPNKEEAKQALKQLQDAI